MKKYEAYVNEHIFSNLFGKKPKEEVTEPKKRKAIKESDSEMIDLLNEIIGKFDIKNLKWDHSDLDQRELKWTYKLDGVEIWLKRDSSYSSSGIRWRLRIGSDEVALTMVSEPLLQELADFFYEQEKRERIRQNSEIFGKVLPYRKDAEKYNL